MTTLVLASSSQYRKMLLSNIGIQAETCSPEIDETPLTDEPALTLSLRLAEQKAKKVGTLLTAHHKSHHEQSIVIGSDQVALVETSDGPKLLGKPGSIDNAVAQLMECQGKVVSFYTALSLHCPYTNKTVTEVDETRVHFRNNDVSSIRAYVTKERPLDCAGSFKSEGMGILLFKRIESRDPNSLIGLPLMLLNDLLTTHFDVDLLKLAAR